MKIYVDELPKSCGECPFNYDSIGCEVFEPKTGEDGDELRRCLDSMYGNIVKDAITDRRFSKCPLETTQSLKQQVREEVVDEIKDKIPEIGGMKCEIIIDDSLTLNTLLDTILKKYGDKNESNND